MTNQQAPRRTPFLITVDAEGDDLWSRPRCVTTRNSRFLPRFHELCRRHDLRPTYLATFEMAVCPEFQAFGRAILAGGEGEIGMHLHAWSSPPDVPLGDRDYWHQPYATQYPAPAIHAKAWHLTRLLEDTFQAPVRSHRGGRWAFDETCARVLAGLGYQVDSSVTPHVSWRQTGAQTVDPFAPDYTGFPETPYFVDLDDIRRPGRSGLLEVPVTTVRVRFDRGAAPGGADSAFVRWLRPNGRNSKALRWVVDQALADRRPCLVLMLHSSELMPGGSPASRGDEDVEALYRSLEALFDRTAMRCRGATLSEFHLEVAGRTAARTQDPH